ncbi:MAG: hypothetical protein HP496_10495 [Nitrospira sp.]|nr:hypothetical protein [Nitrospira sp.]
MTLLTNAEYLDLGRRIMPLLGSALGGPSAEALRELARVYAPSADDSHISAEVFLFHKYLLMQACVGVFPQAQVDHIVGGLFAALNERASGLGLGMDRQRAMEEMWQQRAGQFDRPFSQDRGQVLGEGAGPAYWKQMIGRFCQNVHKMADPPDIWSGTDGPSHLASQSVTAVLDRMVSALGEINRLHFEEQA